MENITTLLGNILINKDKFVIIDKLESANGNTNKVFIYDVEFRENLFKNGFILRDNIGWAWSTPLLRSAIPNLRKLFVPFCFKNKKS